MEQDYPQMAEEMIIDDVETLKVLADPGRIQIMRAFDKPHTVKEVAHYLDRPATKLYYHVKMLQKHHIIQVVETNVVSGIIEKKYQVTAKQFRPAVALLTATEMDAHLEAVLAAVFDTAKIDIKNSIEAGLINMALEESEQAFKTIIAHHKLHLTQAQAVDFGNQLQALLAEYDSVDESVTTNTTPFGLAVGFYPLHRFQEAQENA